MLTSRLSVPRGGDLKQRSSKAASNAEVRNARRCATRSAAGTLGKMRVSRRVRGESVRNPGHSETSTVLVASSAGTVAVALPAFLMGALAVQIRESLHFGPGALGLIVAFYYVGAAAASVPLGRLVESFGALRTMRVACIVSAVVLEGLAWTTRNPAVLAAWLVLAGLASAGMQPAANLYMVRRLPRGRQGLAFGLKQSAVPLTATLAGLSVPAVALTLGWRAAFGLAGAFAFAVAVTLPRPRRTRAEQRAVAAAERTGGVDNTGRGALWVLAVGFGLGVASAGALTAFLASSVVAAGMGRAAAGLLVALGGVAAITGRIAAGWMADRRSGGHLTAVAVMLAVGSAAYLALALVSYQRLAALIVPVVIVVFTVGWGWNGLFNFAIIDQYRERPAWATGITQTGGRLGGVFGPFVFGQIATHASYGAAWASLAVASASAATITAIVARRSRGADSGHA